MATEVDTLTQQSTGGAYMYGAKHLEKGRLVANDNGTTEHLVDDSGNKIKFFTIVEEG